MFRKNYFVQVICVLVCVLAMLGCKEKKVKVKVVELSPSQIRHAELVDKANETVAKRWEENKHDPLYPVYHVRSQAHYINDPTGPIFYNGKYHLFFQQEIYTAMEQKLWAVGRGWGHVASDDLVYWEQWPIAIVPSEPYDAYDKVNDWGGGCWSGTCVIGPDGFPVIIYSVRPEGGQGIATSYDGMKTWVKHPDNPVLKHWEDESSGFRDPFPISKDGDTYNIIIGSQWNDEAGIHATATVYESKDLVNWKFVNPLLRGHDGIFYECPGMLGFGDKYIFWASLSTSEMSETKCVVGDYKDRKFIPEGQWQYLNFGADGSFYAPTAMTDQKGRVIMWGYIGCRGTEPVRMIDGKEKTFRWSQVQSVPRHLYPRPDGRVGMEPIPELKQLRGKGYRFTDITQNPDSPNILKDIKGDALEIIAEFENIDADSYGLDVWRSEDGNKSVPIVHYAENERFSIGAPGVYSSVSGAFSLLEDEKTVQMHIFIDKLVVEAYLNKREYIAYGSGLRQPEELGLSIITTGGSVKIKSLEIWEMNSCYK